MRHCPLCFVLFVLVVVSQTGMDCPLPKCGLTQVANVSKVVAMFEMKYLSSPFKSAATDNGKHPGMRLLEGELSDVGPGTQGSSPASSSPVITQTPRCSQVNCRSI